MILSLGAFLGFFSVAFGAYAEHGLKAKISEQDFYQIMTALKYNQIHAVVLVVLGLFLLSSPHHKLSKLIRISGWLFFAGVILFSFSIYGSKLFDIAQLVKLAPIGGITLMTAWLSLAYAGIRSIKN